MIFLSSVSRLLYMRSSRISRAIFSSSTALKGSPASGTPSLPIILTGVDGPADSSLLLFSSSIKRTLPELVPTTKGSPVLSVPF